MLYYVHDNALKVYFHYTFVPCASLSYVIVTYVFLFLYFFELYIYFFIIRLYF